MKKIAQFLTAPAIIVALVAATNLGSKDAGAQAVEPTTATPVAVQPDPFVEALPVELKKGRLTAANDTIVCDSWLMMDKVFNLHSAGRSDLVLANGCRYLHKGAQGTRIDWAKPYHQILFTTAQGTYVMWGHREHFQGPEFVD